MQNKTHKIEYLMFEQKRNSIFQTVYLLQQKNEQVLTGFKEYSYYKL